MDEIHRTYAELESERAELLVAKKVIERIGDDGPAILESRKVAPVMVNRTNRNCIVAALTEASRWLTANEIQDRASAFKGITIPMASISPGLTDLKNDGVIVRAGLLVALASRAAELGEPTESAPSLIPDHGDQTGAG